MAGHQAVGRLGVLMLAPALGQHVFLLRVEQGKFADLGQVMPETAFIGQCRKRAACHSNPFHFAQTIKGAR